MHFFGSDAVTILWPHSMPCLSTPKSAVQTKMLVYLQTAVICCFFTVVRQNPYCHSPNLLFLGVQLQLSNYLQIANYFLLFSQLIIHSEKCPVSRVQVRCEILKPVNFCQFSLKNYCKVIKIVAVNVLFLTN